MRQLIATQNNARHVAGPASAPRLLVQFWDDAAAVPDDVQTCLDSWAPLEMAGFTRTLFDDTSARRFIEDQFSARYLEAFDRCSHPAMRSDYFRLCFILRIGGMYIDADDEYQGGEIEHLVGSGRLRIQALCYDIGSDSMVDVSDALADTTGAKRIFYVNNNPLIAGAGHPVIARALERSTTLLLSANATNRDLQSITGPGNLTAVLVAHAAQQDADSQPRDFELLPTWDAVAISKWPLAYRADGRNWRNWVRGDAGGDPS
ncbi:glycosyltransferase family 32 protein [Homoserinimonas sp. A520]